MNCVWTLQVYNPYLDSLPYRAVSHHFNVKKYNDDGELPADDDKSDHVTGHRDRHLSLRGVSEMDYERRVRRRRSRLMTAAEDAFAVIRRMTSSNKGVWSSLWWFDRILDLSGDQLLLST